MKKIANGTEYIDSLRNRDLKIYLFGELVEDPVEHPMIRPSINALARTYDLAVEAPELASVISPFTGERVSRFLHVCTSAQDLVKQNKMQRKLGQDTGTCFQRCVGMDAFNALYSVTFEMDEAYGTSYHKRMKTFLTLMHQYNYVIGGAMTDVKGDRSLPPHQQEDMYVRITKRDENGVYIYGAKAHQTGCINSHWIIVMPTLRLGAEDKDFAIVGAIPV
ncbi:MAG: 4-hydroxybutyryl-CoA dehydratase/vinylacetyl-CoA-Delta-isomerase, partial [Saprospiraceae bacterium]